MVSRASGRRATACRRRPSSSGISASTTSSVAPTTRCSTPSRPTPTAPTSSRTCPVARTSLRSTTPRLSRRARRRASTSMAAPPRRTGPGSDPLGENDDQRDVDFGYTGTGSIGDTIWFDQNRRRHQGRRRGRHLGGRRDQVVVGQARTARSGGTDDERVRHDDDGRRRPVPRVENLPAGGYHVVVNGADRSGRLLRTSPTRWRQRSSESSRDRSVSPRTISIQDFGYRGHRLDRRHDLSRPERRRPRGFGEPGVVGVTVAAGPLRTRRCARRHATTPRSRPPRRPDGAYLFDEPAARAPTR